MVNGKKGASEVITTVLLIVIAIVVIGIVGVVLFNFVKNNTSNISGLNLVHVDIEKEKVKLNSNNLDLVVRRDSVSGNMSGLKIVFIDENEKTYTYNYEGEISELETKIISIPVSELQGNIGNLSRIEVYPIALISKKIVTGSLSDTYLVGKGFVSDEGLVLYLPFDGNVNDLSNNNFQVSNFGADSVQGKINGAYDFNGIPTTGDYMSVIDHPKLDINGELTVSSWVYAKSPPGQYNIDCSTGSFGPLQGRSVVSKYDYNSGIERGWNFGADWCGNYFSLQINDPSGLRVLVSNNTFFQTGLNKWINFVGVYKPSSYMRLYQDGVLVAQLTSSVPSSLVYSNALDPVVIGRRSVQSQSNFNGTIDEVRIYNRSLSSEEIYYLYKYG